MDYMSYNILGVVKMDDYLQIYLKLFNKISDIIIELEKIQQEAEELFISIESEHEEN